MVDFVPSPAPGHNPMIKLLLKIIVALLVTSSPALAAYTATGQFCQLSPDRAKPEILASCAMPTANKDGGKNMEVIVVGQRPNKVREIRFVGDGDKKPTQVLALSAAPLIDPETVAIMLVDFNFDGYEDFAIMTNISTSENVRYLFFLFDPQTGRFVASPAMAEIVNPEVIAAKNQIRSYWRENPATSGWNLWKWQNGKPWIATRIEQSTNRKVQCRQTIIRYKDGRSKKGQPTPCR